MNNNNDKICLFFFAEFFQQNVILQTGKHIILDDK